MLNQSLKVVIATMLLLTLSSCSKLVKTEISDGFEISQFNEATQYVVHVQSIDLVDPIDVNRMVEGFKYEFETQGYSVENEIIVEKTGGYYLSIVFTREVL